MLEDRRENSMAGTSFTANRGHAKLNFMEVLGGVRFGVIGVMQENMSIFNPYVSK